MDTKSKIKQELKKHMSDGEANACQIFRGYDNGTGLTGWHFKRFGQNATFVGSNAAEIKEFFEQWHRN